MEYLETIIKFLAIPASLAVVLLVAVVLLNTFPHLYLVSSKTLAALGSFGKWFRRKSIESQIQGAVNGFSRELNSSSGISVLPDCDVEWVTEKNQGTILQPGKAIVKLSFSSRDHDLNYYNAAQTYVAESLLAHTKPFMTESTTRAIDLVVIHNLLRRSRREALRVFNGKFREEREETQLQYREFEQTEEERLFSRILLPELHLFGHAVGDQAPSDLLIAEVERLVRWFCDLATREPGQDTVLHHEGAHLKVGVILVAAQDTFDMHGTEPYIRRAYDYAGRGYDGIYLLSRGQRRSDLALRIASDLCSQDGFTQVTSTPNHRVTRQGDAFIVTCILLRPDTAVIEFNAWSKLSEDFHAGRQVVGVIDGVSATGIEVSVYGLSFSVDLKHLSKRSLKHPFSWFRRKQELSLRVLEVNANERVAALSNVETETDPDRVISLVDEGEQQAYRGRVAKIVLSNDAEVGMRVKLELSQGEEVYAFVPRRRAMRSRYASLALKYPLDSVVIVEDLKFEPQRSELQCQVADLADPWATISRYSAGQAVTTIVREITENHAICELEEGLEGWLHVGELSWGTDAKNQELMRNLEVGVELKVIILRIDEARRHIRVSVKRFQQSPTSSWFRANAGQLVVGNVTEVQSTYALLGIDSLPTRASLHISEVSWWFTNSMSDAIEVGDEVRLRVISYDHDRDEARVSIRQAMENDFERMSEVLSVGDTVDCIVLEPRPPMVRLRVIAGGKVVSAGYLHKSEVSNCIFIEDQHLSMLFQTGDAFRAIIKRFDNRNRVVEVSRRAAFELDFESLDYAVMYPVTVVRSRRGPFGYGPDVEGRLTGPRIEYHETGAKVGVSLARKGETVRDVELQLECGEEAPSTGAT